MRDETESFRLKRTVALACRILYDAGLVSMTLGHVSARGGVEDHFLIKPRGLGLEEVTPDDVIVVDSTGQVVEGSHPRPGEWPMHAEILRARPDVNSVVHVHPFYANVLGSSGVKVEPFTHDGVFFVDSVGYYEDADLILDAGQGGALAEALGHRTAIFLRNHGVVVVGASVEEACVLTLLLEEAAKAQVYAMQLNLHAPMAAGTAHGIRDRVLGFGRLKADWDYLVRKLALDW